MRATEPCRSRCPFSRHTPKTLRQGGFTLVELVMGLGFMLVMSAIIAPNLQSSLNAYRLNSALNSLAGKLATAHFKALSGNTDFEVVISSSSGVYQLDQLTSSSPRTFSLASGEELINLPTGVSFGFGSANLAAGNSGEQPSLAQSTAIAFNSLGWPVDSSGNPTPANAFYLTCNGQSGAVTVSQAGKIETWLWNGSAWVAL